MRYKLELIVFLCGALVMVMELAGSRLMAPYIGTSLYVWTSLIGIILGSLSLGYWWGGLIADKYPEYRRLALIMIASSVYIANVALFQRYFLTILTQYVSDIRISAVVACIFLFAVPSVLLGMISPYAVKLKLHSLQTSGVAVGSLYALSTLGSIFGTFLSGFVLIAWLGSTSILFLISALLFSLAIFVDYKLLLGSFWKLSVFILFISLSVYAGTFFKSTIIDIDTNYSRIWIYDTFDEKYQKDVRMMVINSEYNSGAFLDSDHLYFEYTKYYDLANYFMPGYKNTLMIGGAGYSYPTYLLKKHDEVKVDVVEIDPEMTRLAKQFFKLKDNPRLAVFHEDGRTFLNNNQKKYDVIYGDAFKSLYSIPFQLTTVEAFQKISDSLTDDGALLINVISAIEGEKGKILSAEYATLRRVFPQVYAFAVTDKNDKSLVQNIMMVASKSKNRFDLKSEDMMIQGFLNNEISLDGLDGGMILTDDYAPIDALTAKFLD